MLAPASRLATANTVTIERSSPLLVTDSPPVGSALATTTKNAKNTTWTTPLAELDVRPGGANLIVMRNPEGEEFPNQGVYLEVVRNERLVFTDAYVRAWEPAQQPFMTVILTFDDLGGKTRYTARVLHWTAAAREQHEQMGFHQGWGQCADQLAELLKRM